MIRFTAYRVNSRGSWHRYFTSARKVPDLETLLGRWRKIRPIAGRYRNGPTA